MKNNLLLLVPLLMLGCAGVDVRQNVNTNGPSAVVKRALAYMQSDQAEAGGRATGFTGEYARGKSLPDDLILKEVKGDMSAGSMVCLNRGGVLGTAIGSVLSRLRQGLFCFESS